MDCKRLNILQKTAEYFGNPCLSNTKEKKLPISIIFRLWSLDLENFEILNTANSNVSSEDDIWWNIRHGGINSKYR